EVNGVRAGGEPDPVVLLVSPEDAGGRALLAELGFDAAELQGLSPVVAVPEAEVADLLNRHVSGGVGDYLVGAPGRPDHAFRGLVASQGKLALYVLVFEENQPYLVGSLSLDLDTRVLRLTTPAGHRQQIEVDW